ncbi:MAG: hypothetical protein ILP09_03240 [Oscillospiraceae bacterium]|nr:hypothetical protein [Oscillospiraceae bacterium]
MAKKEVFTPIWSFDDGDGEKAEKKKAEKERNDAPARSKSSKTGSIDFGRSIYTDKEDERLRNFRVTPKAGEEKKPLPRKTKLVVALVVLLLLAIVAGWFVLSVKWRRDAYPQTESISIVPMIKPR